MTGDTLQHLYAVRHPDGFWKVGTASDAKHRLSGIQTGSPYELTCEYVLTYLQPDRRMLDHPELENVVQRKLSDEHVRGEWYNVTRGRIVEVLEQSCYEFDFVDGFYQYPEHEELSYHERAERYHTTFMRVMEDE